MSVGWVEGEGIVTLLTFAFVTPPRHVRYPG